MLYYLDLDYLDSSKTSMWLMSALPQGTVYQRNPFLTKNGAWGQRQWLFVDPEALMMGDSYADSLARTFQVEDEAADHVPGCRAASHQLRLEHLTLGPPERTEISKEVAGVGGQSRGRQERLQHQGRHGQASR